MMDTPAWLASQTSTACGKWRLVGLRAANQFAEHFTCRDNPDPKHRWCETPQELPDDEIDRQLGLAPPPPPLALPAPNALLPARKPSLLDSARVLGTARVMC